MKVLLATFSAVALMLAAGCGGEAKPPRLSVSGYVTSGDKPLAKGRIIFQPTGPGLQGGGPIVDGKYALDSSNGPGAGGYRVLIYGGDEPAIAMDDPEAFATSDLVKRPPVEPVAAEFNVESKLSARISAGSENKFDFKVSTKPKADPAAKRFPGGEQP